MVKLLLRSAGIFLVFYFLIPDSEGHSHFLFSLCVAVPRDHRLESHHVSTVQPLVVWGPGIVSSARLQANGSE